MVLPAIIAYVIFAASVPNAMPFTASPDGAGLVANDRGSELSNLKEKYDGAHDAVHRAKALAQLGEAQVKDAGARMTAHDYAGALTELREYRDEVAATHKDLQALHVNAERKPAGFRELQVSVRENLRRIEDMAFTAPLSQQDALVEIHEQLGEENGRLLTELFPEPNGGGPAIKPGHP